MNTIKQMLILLMLPVAVSAQAACVNDAPEIGDTGPSSEVVCDQLEGRFAGAVLAVEGRSIHSPTEVSVHTSVDGTPVRMRYELGEHQKLGGWTPIAARRSQITRIKPV